MARAAMRVIVILPVLWLCGCGSMLSSTVFENKLGSYGGVKLDAVGMYETYPFPPTLLCIADMPLSFVADTLLLPFTLSRTHQQQKPQKGGQNESPLDAELKDHNYLLAPKVLPQTVPSPPPADDPPKAPIQASQPGMQ